MRKPSKQIKEYKKEFVGEKEIFEKARYRSNHKQIECLIFPGKMGEKAELLQKRFFTPWDVRVKAWGEAHSNHYLITLGKKWFGKMFWKAFKILLYCPTSNKDHSRNPNGPCFLSLPATKRLIHTNRIQNKTGTI